MNLTRLFHRSFVLYDFRLFFKLFRYIALYYLVRLMVSKNYFITFHLQDILSELDEYQTKSNKTTKEIFNYMSKTP